MACRSHVYGQMPLLCASGCFACLYTMTAHQIEKFIPLMLSCCQNIEKQSNLPVWWVESVPFDFPLRKPASISDIEWLKNLQSIVRACYAFYNQEWLIPFCANLSAYQRNELDYVDVENKATGIVNKSNNQLLVVVKNINLVSLSVFVIT